MDTDSREQSCPGSAVVTGITVLESVVVVVVVVVVDCIFVCSPDR